MISFRQKFLVQDLISDAMDYLKKAGVPFNTITLQEADEASKVNSKALVLVSFVRNELGYYQIQIKDKELYRFTQKLIGDYFRMRITNVDKEGRTITAECDHKGIALDCIEILGRKYNLSIVKA